jgi:5-methylcytosine-specific restriction endonuclease McrA
VRYISKKQREEIKQKFDGLCAYSGTRLEDDWQIDHVKPLVRNRFDNTPMFPDADYAENLIPCQKIINHYKRSLDLERFRRLLCGLHKRIDKPKNPKTEKSKRKKAYLNKVASYFKITPENPFDGIFYFERVTLKDSSQYQCSK